MNPNDPHRHVVLRGVSPRRLRAFAGLALVVLALGGWGLFALGRSGIGAGDTGPMSSPAALRQAIRERDELIDSLRRSAAELDTFKAAQNPERQEVSRAIGELQAEVARQRQQLEFYKGVVASAEPAPNVAIRSLRVETSTGKGQAQLRLSLVQPGNPQSLVSGQVKVILEGARSGRFVRIQLLKIPYNFRYLENIDRELSIPAGVSPERLQIEIEPSGGSGRSVVQSLLWPL